MYDHAEVKGSVATVDKVAVDDAHIYIVVYVHSVHAGMVVAMSSSLTTAKSNQGLFAASVAVFSVYVPAVSVHPEDLHVPMLLWKSL